MKKCIIFIFVTILMIFIVGCNTEKKEIKLSLQENNIELTVGDIYEIEPIVENIKDPIFEINTNSEIVSIDNKTVTALSAGECEIVISIKDKKDVPSVSLNITVKDIVPNKINAENEISLLVGNTKKIEYTFEPSNAVAEVLFNTSDSSIVSVDKNGLINALNSGKAVVTISLNIDGSTVKKEILVEVRGKDAPVFNTNDEFEKANLINWGTEIDYLRGLTALDIEDGDITKNIQVLNQIDSQEYGKHQIEYKVSDKDGNEATFTREVEVIWNYDVQFIGHAGSYYGAMNSEEAILYAITELKYQCVEIDLKQTKDGVFVLCHDDTFGGYSLGSTNWADLKDVEINSSRTAGIPFQNGEAPGNGKYTAKLCTLERYLEICKQYNVKAVIELKSSNGITNSNQSRMQALMNEIEKADMLENVIFLGSQYNCLIWTRKNGYDYIPCQYLVNSCESDTYLQRCIDNNLDISINATGSNISNSEEWIAKYKEAGLKVSTYTYTQYVDYEKVQEWIDKGVDFVTCDWHRMDKLKLPVSSNEPVKKFNVKFLDEDGTILKEREVKQGATAAAPSVPKKEGYDFIGWDNDLKNIQSDMVFTAKYEPTKYSITYIANLGVVKESSWDTKDAFVNDFYNDLFEWIKSKGTEISGLKIEGTTYKLTRNNVTVTFSSAKDIKAINVYDFEKTISNILYKPVTRNSDGTCVIVEDNNYFLNSSSYRIKYQGMDQWLYNCIKTTALYSSYDTTYTPTSSGKIQIFFRMHQWMNGTNIVAFNKYPIKYIVEKDSTINVTMPTSPISYTIVDEVLLPVATGDIQFLGWYDNPECTGEAMIKIEKGTTGNIILYAKWSN